jgi:hypothetical protein
LVVGNTTDKAIIQNLGDADTIVFLGENAQVDSIKAEGTIGSLFAMNNLTVTNSITAEVIGSIFVRGKLTVGSIDTSIAIKSILVSKDFTVQAGGSIKAGELLRMVVGGNMSGTIQVTDGDIGSYIYVRKNFTGRVNTDGDITSIIVMDSFTPSNGTAYLVNAKGSLDSLDVGENLGAPLPSGDKVKIVAKEIDTIQVGKNIVLKSIETTNGDINAILALSGSMDAPVTAIGGDIYTVKVKQLAPKANITAKENAQETGGSIAYVQATDSIDDSVRIWAQDAVGTIVVTNPTVPKEKFQVFTLDAQTYNFSTGRWDPDPMTINVGTAAFEGTVTFRKGGLYVNYENLLKVTDATGTNQWYVGGTGSGTVSDPLVFTLNTGTFGWVKTNKPFTNANLTVTKDQ